MTHINAYHGLVEEKKQALTIAEAELSQAETLLKGKLLEEGISEPVVKPKLKSKKVVKSKK